MTKILHEVHSDDLKSVNDAFDISLKAKELYDAGLLDKGMSIMNQAANLGALMWTDILEHVSDSLIMDESSPGIDRGEHVVVK